MEENKTKQMFKILNFNEAYVPPVMKYNDKLNIIEWGDKNLYPKYILDTYNNFGSSIHKNIINKKTKLVAGKGFKEIVDPALLEFVKKNKLEKELKKAALDYELFNGFSFEVIWNNAGTAITSLRHIPFSKLRIGIENDDLKFPHVWFSNDWEKYKKEGYEPEMIRTFNPLIKQGKQIYYYSEYNPANDELYPIPGYSTSFNWIELEYQISIFHLNQAKQGYAPSFILNFATGIPTEEEMDEFAKQFKRNFAGTENAGKIIITYSEGVDQKPELTAIQLNDSDERFIMLMDQIESHIVSGAEIPPQLVILTPGKLGSSAERAELMNEFQQSYVTPRQEVIEGVLNEILGAAGYTEELALETFIEEDAPVANDREAEARAALKGSVGGVQGIIQIQTSVAQGLTSRSSAQALLELIYGFAPEDAIRLLGDVQEGAGIDPAVQQQLNDIKNKL
jgi:hypothetical protein